MKLIFGSEQVEKYENNICIIIFSWSYQNVVHENRNMFFFKNDKTLTDKLWNHAKE